MKMVNLFAGGAAGWEYAARDLGWPEADGAENDDDARKTREATGFRTPFEDVRDLEELPPWTEVLGGSPPCTRFAKAGNSPAHRHLVKICQAVRAGVAPTVLANRIGDPVAALVLEPIRLIEKSRPPFVALEQTPTVLPVWKEYAARMRWLGYSVATGIVSAADYGVPQTRSRAVLLARLDGCPVKIPEPTHPWPVPMLSVIDRDPAEWVQRSNYSAPMREGARTAAERGRTMRPLWRPSVTITSKVFNWQHRDGHLEPCSVQDSADLQGFPADHKWQGGTGAARLQIGNAIPRRLAYVLLKEVTRPRDRFEVRDLAAHTREVDA